MAAQNPPTPVDTPLAIRYSAVTATDVNLRLFQPWRTSGACRKAGFRGYFFGRIRSAFPGLIRSRFRLRNTDAVRMTVECPRR